MTRKQMEQKIEELSAELAELRKEQAAHHCCHGATCVHWHYTSWPNTINTAAAQPWQYQVYTGGSTYQITAP